MIKYTFILLLLLPSVIHGRTTREEIVTLAECQEWAENNYPLIRQYSVIEKTENYNLSNATKGWLPQLSFTGKATYQSDVTTLPFDSEQLSALIPGFNIPTISKDQYQVVGEVNQNLWDGGQIRSARNLTKAQAEADREQLKSDLYAIRQRVNQVYFGALLQDELLKQNLLLQEDLLINTGKIEAMIANGVANQSDLENIQVELLNTQQKEIELLAARKAYRQMLSVLTGKEIPQTALLLEPPLPSRARTWEIKRPELAAFDARERLAGIQNERINANLMPTVGLFFQGGYGRPGLNFLDNKFKAYYVTGVRFSWNMGKLYTLKNDRRLIQTNRQAIDIQRDVFLFNTNLQMEQQSTDIQKMEDLMKSDQEIIRLRKSIKEASAVKLENGIISVADYIRDIHAEDMAIQTGATHRIQLLSSIYEYLYTTSQDL